MSNLAEERVKMTPQLSQKDVPQEPSDSEPEDVEDNGTVFIETSSEEEDNDDDADHVELENDGYVPLVQDTSDLADEDLPDQSFIEDDGGTESGNATDKPGDNCERCEEESEDNVSMEQDQVDLIRQVMMNISLPSAAIPDWANNVPEEKWKAMLVSNITNRNQQRGDTDQDTRR